MSKIDLRRLILLLVLSTGVITFGTSYLTQCDLLMSQALGASHRWRRTSSGQERPVGDR